MIDLPYPPASLNPNRANGRHWAVTRPIKDKYKADCKAIASQFEPMREFGMLFHPPNARRRDIDNAIASMKAGIDGISEAWGIDDSEFLITFPRKFGEKVTGGKVVIYPVNNIIDIGG